MMKYHYASDAYGNPTQTFFRERLIRNIPELRWQGFIHEYIQPFGNVIYADIAILHLKEHSVPMRNLEIYNKKINEGVKLSPRDQFYYAKELYYNQNYICAAAQFNVFLEGNQGWVENNIEAFLLLHSFAAAGAGIAGIIFQLYLRYSPSRNLL